MGLFPVNPDEVTEEPMAGPDDDSCRLGISRHCTEDGKHLWQGTPACDACLALAMDSEFAAFERELTPAEDLWARR
jgi:hypothetical protein